MNNGKVKIGKLNILASTLAFLFTVYFTVMYIILMCGETPDTLAYEITTDNAINWVYRFVLVILMYVFCLANLISIPTYLFLKHDKSRAAGTFAGIQIVSTVCMFIVALLFWCSFGVIFMPDMSSPFATPFRIMEIVFTPVMVGLEILTILYVPSDDIMRKLKRKHDKI